MGTLVFVSLCLAKNQCLLSLTFCLCLILCSSLKTVKVELSVLAPSGNDAVGEDMKNFADQLRPLVSASFGISDFNSVPQVVLEKFDLRRSQM